jgi:hypothetical protein
MGMIWADVIKLRIKAEWRRSILEEFPDAPLLIEVLDPFNPTINIDGPVGIGDVG